MANTTKNGKRNEQAHGELSDEQLDTVAGGRGFFNEIIAKGMAIAEVQNHPVLEGLKTLK